MWVIAHKNLGLQPQIHGTENRGMSVQLLGNKYGGDNSGRQISGLVGERQREGKAAQRNIEKAAGGGGLVL